MYYATIVDSGRTNQQAKGVASCVLNYSDFNQELRINLLFDGTKMDIW